MNCTDCPIIGQIPGKVSGAPILMGTRIRPQDIIANAEMGAAWIADAYDLPLGDVWIVLAFFNAHRDELPLEYFPPAYVWQRRVGWDALASHHWRPCEP